MDGNVVLDMVDDLDEHCVVFSSINGGAWEFSVDGDDRLG